MLLNVKKTILKYINLLILILFAMICFSAICNAASTTVYQDIIDEVTNNKKEAAYNVDLNAPFVKDKSGIREIIDPETGELSVKCDIFNIQGRADNNLNLSLMYRTSLSNVKEENVEITTTTSGTSTVTTGKNVIKDKTDFEKSQMYFGAGWQLYFPYIEQQNENNKTSVYVHMPNGSVYLKDTTAGTGLKDYKLSDVSFNTDSVTKDGNTYSFRLIYTDGTIYYFSNDGYLSQKVDKYNNTVYYDWITKDKFKLIKYITDNSSRKIIFDYDDKDITVSFQDQKYRFIRTAIDGETGAYYLSTIIDPMGRRTEFSYYPQSVSYNFFVTSTPYPASTEATNNYYILNQVIYPTNVKSVYQYTKSKKWLYEKQNGYIEYVKIQKRYDDNGEKISNVLRYDYGREPDGYPDYKKSELPANYTYLVNETDSIDTRTAYSYNSRHDLFSKEKWTQSKLVSKEIKIFDETLRMPESTVVTNYNDNSEKQEIHIDTAYDSKGNVLKSDTYEINDGSGKYLKEYKYSNSFNLCMYEGYKKDEHTTIEIVRDLDGSGKNIGSEKIIENGREIQNNIYKYDSLGNLTEKRIETEENKYAITTYEYDAKYNMLYPTAITNKGVTNADGESYDVRTSFEYDAYGNVTAAYDGDNNKKSYEYDLLNRKTKEVLEDNVSRSTKYNDKENIIETIDAEGTRLKYNFDPFGKLSTVTDIKKNTILLKREYDAKDRLVNETNAKGTVKECVYNYLDRITCVTYTDANGNILSRKDIAYDTAYQENDKIYTKLTVSQGDNLDLRKTTYLFDTFQRLTEKTVCGENNQNYTTRLEYDYLGNAIKAIDEAGNETTIEYDVFGNKTHITKPEGVEEAYGYNYTGKLLWAKNGEGEITYLTYDSLGREITRQIPYDQNGKYSTVKQYYDGRSNVIRLIDAENNKKEYVYNERNLLSRVLEYSNAADGTASEYKYDNEGRVLKLSFGSIKNAQERKSFENSYDHLGRLIKRIDNLGQKQYYEYDDAGNMTRFTDRNGNITSYEYDGLSRNTRLINSQNGEKVFSYNAFGQISNITENDKKIEYQYNKRGSIEKIIKDFTEEGFVYDIKGNVTDRYIEDKDIGTISTGYVYDKLSRVTRVFTPLGIQEISYDKVGRITASQNNRNGMSRGT